jgi:hypothetical protein
VRSECKILIENPEGMRPEGVGRIYYIILYYIL